MCVVVEDLGRLLLQPFHRELHGVGGYKIVPELRLCGNWLQDAGFEPYQRASVRVTYKAKAAPFTKWLSFILFVFATGNSRARVPNSQNSTTYTCASGGIIAHRHIRILLIIHRVNSILYIPLNTNNIRIFFSKSFNTVYKFFALQFSRYCSKGWTNPRNLL